MSQLTEWLQFTNLEEIDEDVYKTLLYFYHNFRKYILMLFTRFL